MKLDVNNISKYFGEGSNRKKAIEGINFSISSGEFKTLVGSSGSGKSTILRIIAGLESPSKGNVKVDGKIVSGPGLDRGMVFQKYSLFPWLTASENIAFGMNLNSYKLKEIKYRTSYLLEVVGLQDSGNKYPKELSGGMQQRIAIARALATNPKILLLDEPLSNVDQSLKEEIQIQLKKILKNLKITTIVVTHDSYEAFYLGNKCGVILDEKLKQFDDPYKVYHYPNSVSVVNFLNRGILIPAKVTGKNTLENDDLGTIEGKFVKPAEIGSNVKLLLQPEDLIHDDKSNLKFDVVDRKFRGTNFIYTLRTEKGNLLPVFVHSHHIHQHDIDEKFGIKKPVYIDHLVCF